MKPRRGTTANPFRLRDRVVVIATQKRGEVVEVVPNGLRIFYRVWLDDEPETSPVMFAPHMLVLEI